MRERELLVVVPAFNEEASVGAVVTEIKTAIPTAEVLVVDDGSRDSTAEVAQAAGARVAILPFNLGVGGAMRTGYRYALENGFGVVVQVDADGQHDPKAIPSLISRLADSDVVIGARFAGEGDYRVRGPRRWAMSFLSVALSRVCGARLSDTTSGFRATGPRAIKVFADHYPAEYLGDTIEALVIAHRLGLTISQVPVSMRERAAGKPSHHPVRAALSLVRAWFALVFALIRPKSTYLAGGS